MGLSTDKELESLSIVDSEKYSFKVVNSTELAAIELVGSKYHSDLTRRVSTDCSPLCSSCYACQAQLHVPFGRKTRHIRRSFSYPMSNSPASFKARDTRHTQSSGPSTLVLRHIKPTVSSHIKSTEKSSSFWTGFPNTVAMQHTLSLGTRVSSLFALGVFLALLLNFLQRQKGITVFSPGVFGDVLNSAWWIPPTFGIASAAVGLLYPFLDEMIGKRKQFNMEWSTVMRCIALFVGFNHAIAKINFPSNIHLTFVLAILSMGLWYFFDQSLLGLGLGVISTSIATGITQLLVALDVFGYSDPDFIYMRSWVPWLYFSGMITVGTVGRALANLPGEAKEHQD